MCALGMISLCVRGDAGLVPAVGLIRSLSAVWGVTHHSLAARFPCTQTGVHRTLRVKPEDRTRCSQIRWITWCVDTHRDEHVLAVVACPSGAVVAQQSVRASARGYAQALRFVEQHSGRRAWAVEGAGHYGAGLARHLSGRGETVLEIGRGPRDERRLRGKDDSLDAIRAARTALASQTLSLPRAG